MEWDRVLSPSMGEEKISVQSWTPSAVYTNRIKVNSLYYKNEMLSFSYLKTSKSTPLFLITYRHIFLSILSLVFFSSRQHYHQIGWVTIGYYPILSFFSTLFKTYSLAGQTNPVAFLYTNVIESISYISWKFLNTHKIFFPFVYALNSYTINISDGNSELEQLGISIL